MKIKDVIVEDSRIQDIHGIVTGQQGHKGQNFLDKITDVLLGGNGPKNAATIIKYLRQFGLSNGEISQVRDIANQAGKAALDYMARKENIPDKWIASDMKGNFIVYMPYLNAGDAVIERWRELTNKIMLPKLEAQLGNGTYVESQINELDNGPNGTYDDGVRHGAVRSDPARMSYDSYGAQAKDTRAKQSAAKADARAEKARAERQASSALNKQQREERVWEIAQKLERVVSNCVPDGDPIDYMIPYLERMGISGFDVTKWLDKAAQKLQYSSYNDYLESMWEMYNDVNPTDMRDNPWTESVQEDTYREQVGRYRVMRQLNDQERNPEGDWSLVYSTPDVEDAKEVAREEQARWGKMGDKIKIVDAEKDQTSIGSEIERPAY